MLKILRSFNARWRNYQLKHFQQTRWGKNLLSLKRKYDGKRCFIIGNGPSLNVKDLNLLKNEFTFAFNRIYYIFDQTDWRPTFYCTQDCKIARASQNDIKKYITTPYIFAPINLRWYEGVMLNTDYFFCPKQTGDNIPSFSEDIPHEIYVGNTVAYTAMQLAVYLGFTTIYLLGIDHSFSTYQDKNGNIIKDSKVKDYFTEKYNQDKNQFFIPKLDISTLSYLAADEYTRSHTVKIYNATRGGKLEVFQRIKFDSLF